MALPTVYIETTIPSLYHDDRPSPEIVARRSWTRRWWDEAEGRYHRVTSAAVFDEISEGIPEHAETRRSLVADLPLLAIESAVFEIAETYQRHKLMPEGPGGDALHLAIASYHRCDYLLTWNCRHLANANKFGHIRRINSMLGLWTPTLATPLELLGDVDDHE